MSLSPVARPASAGRALLAGCGERLRHVDDAAPLPATDARSRGRQRARDRSLPDVGGRARRGAARARDAPVRLEGQAIYVDPTSPAIDDAHAAHGRRRPGDRRALRPLRSLLALAGDPAGHGRDHVAVRECAFDALERRGAATRDRRVAALGRGRDGGARLRRWRAARGPGCATTTVGRPSATSSTSAVRGSTSPATPSARPRCARSRAWTWRSSA